MHVTMRHDDRLRAVALGAPPIHLEPFALMYCHDDLRGGEVLAFYRTRRAVRERDRSDTQMFVAREPAGRLARGKVDQVVPQMLAPDRPHRGLPPAGEGPHFFAR